MLSTVVVIYLLIGVLYNVLSGHRRVRFAARLIVLFCWPWILCHEGTPRMGAFIRWAEDIDA